MTAKPFDPRAIVAEVKANLETLYACKLHEFVGIPEGAIRCKNGLLYQHYRCARCGGTVDSHGYHWYQRGIEHGKGAK